MAWKTASVYFVRGQPCRGVNVVVLDNLAVGSGTYQTVLYHYFPALDKSGD